MSTRDEPSAARTRVCMVQRLQHAAATSQATRERESASPSSSSSTERRSVQSPTENAAILGRSPDQTNGRRQHTPQATPQAMQTTPQAIPVHNDVRRFRHHASSNNPSGAGCRADTPQANVCELTGSNASSARTDDNNVQTKAVGAITKERIGLAAVPTQLCQFSDAILPGGAQGLCLLPAGAG